VVLHLTFASRRCKRPVRTPGRSDDAIGSRRDRELLMTSTQASFKPLRALGGFHAMALDTLVLIPRRPFAWREFLAAVLVRRTRINAADRDAGDPVHGAADLHVQHLAGRVQHCRLLGWAARSPQVLSWARDVSRTLDLLWLKHHTIAGRWPTVLIRSRPIQVGERARPSPCIGAAPNGIEIGHPSPL
jgi:hypothetical protein